MDTGPQGWAHQFKTVYVIEKGLEGQQNLKHQELKLFHIEYKKEFELHSWRLCLQNCVAWCWCFRAKFNPED